MQAKIKSNSKVTIGAMEYEGESILSKIFDLKGHEGERIRVHIGDDNKLTIETRPTQKLLVCELDVPTKKTISVDTGKKDEFEQPIMESKEQEVDLSKVEIKEYPKEVR